MFFFFYQLLNIILLDEFKIQEIDINSYNDKQNDKIYTIHFQTT